MLRSAAYLAADMKGALMVFTRRGIFAQKLSSLRCSVPIYAFTDNPVLFKQLLIMRGVEPFLMDFDHEHETTIQRGFERLKEQRWCQPGDPMVVITKMYAGQQRKLIDSTQIREIE
jgi:pyruvate kinase